MYRGISIRHIRSFSRCARLSPLADAFNGYSPSAAAVDPSTRSLGLFRNTLLKTPKGFADLVSKATNDCQYLLAEATSNDRSRKMVQVLDDISDTLCRVADLADCIRTLHPDAEFRNAASDACHAIGCLVEQLNTNNELYSASVHANTNADTTCPKSDLVDQRVLQLFIADFELSGVQLRDQARKKEFLRSASDVLSIGAEFVQAAHSPYILRTSELSPEAQRLLRLSAIAGDIELSHPLLDHPLSVLRTSTYRAYYSPIDNQEERIFNLMSARHRMARAAGFPCYADRAVMHSVAETPARVTAFLERLQHRLRPVARRTAFDLLSPVLRSQQTPSSVDPGTQAPSGGRLWPWDVPFALAVRRHTLQHESLKDFFSLGACMEGVSQLAECLFKLHLRVEPVGPDETWHSSVLKVAVYSAAGAGSEQLVGLVYCDLLDRPGKPSQDCHYTIQGGRQLGATAEDYQIPIITLQLTLTPSSCESSGEPPLLSFGQVENLFHEWGHALHSMVARTRYQHVTGTRCSTDLAELPSTLFEHFGMDPRVVAQYARHWSTGRSPNQAERIALEHVNLARGLGQSVELAIQVTYAHLDQYLHSGDPERVFPPHHKGGVLPSAQLLTSIQQDAGISDWSVCEDTAATTIGCWPHRFAHLVGYGGRYYAYLMAKAGAELVWHRCFVDDPWSSAMGELYADRLLRHGGEHSPTGMLAHLLTGDQYEEEQPDNLASQGQHSLHLLSPERLADGLANEVDLQEESAATLVMKLESPGMYQPRSGRRN